MSAIAHSSESNSGKRGVLLILAVAAGLSLLWLFFIQLSSHRASYGESNYQANLVRADTYLYGPHREVVLVGTSITGRVLPEFFKNQGMEVYNLGMDGCIPRTGLDIVLKKATLPKIVLLETVVMPRAQERNDLEILQALEGVTFRLGRYMPIVRASSRPSSILYSMLKKRSDQQVHTNTPSQPPVTEGPTAAPAKNLIPGKDPKTEIKNLEHSIEVMKAKGVRVVLLRLPVGGQKARIESTEPDLADRLSKELSLPILDAASILKSRGIKLSFSDGTHMRGPSAQEAAKVIIEGLLTVRQKN